MKFFSTEALLEREQKVMAQLTNLLEEASFYELPEEVMLEAIGPDNVGEHVEVIVSPDDYDLLKFWVIGMDVRPLDDRPWYVIAGERARSMKERTTTSFDPLSKYNYKTSLAIKILSRLWTKVSNEFGIVCFIINIIFVYSKLTTCNSYTMYNK